MDNNFIELTVPVPGFTVSPITYSGGYAVKVNIFVGGIPEAYQLIGFKSEQEARKAGMKLAHSRLRELVLEQFEKLWNRVEANQS